LIGSALDGVGYLFQFLALRRGSLILVEPLLVLSLVFALPVAAWLDHRRISAAELTPTAVIAPACVALLRAANVGSRDRAAVLFALGSGMTFGYVAALTERTGRILN